MSKYMFLFRGGRMQNASPAAQPTCVMPRTIVHLFAITVLLAIVHPAAAQADTISEREVLSVIDRFFACMTTRDSAGMADILEPEGVFTIVETGPEAKPIRTVTHANYLGLVKKGAGTLQERYWNATVRLDSSVAVVSCPYDFHFDGNFSHCGLNVFTLVKRDGHWRIAGCVFSLRKEGCTPSPLGPLKN